MARSQKATRLSGFEEFTRLTMPMGERNAAAHDNLNDDKVYRDLAEIAGLPADYLRDEKERDGLRSQRAQKLEMEQKMAVAQQAAEMGGKMAPLIKDSPLGGTGGGDMDIEALLAQLTGGGRPGGAGVSGWQCPGCGRGYSTFVTACGFCGPSVWTANATILPCPGCGDTPCSGRTSGCPLPPLPVITS